MPPPSTQVPQAPDLACLVHAVSLRLGRRSTPRRRSRCLTLEWPAGAASEAPGRGGVRAEGWARTPRSRDPAQTPPRRRPRPAQAPPPHRLRPPAPGRRHWLRAPPPSASHFLAEPWPRSRPARGLRRSGPAAPPARPRRRGSPRRASSVPSQVGLRARPAPALAGAGARAPSGGRGRGRACFGRVAGAAVPPAGALCARRSAGEDRRARGGPRGSGLGRGPPPPQVGQVRPERRRAAQVGERPRVPPPAPSPLCALPSLAAGASPPGRLLCRLFRLAVPCPRKPRRCPPRAGTGECGRASGSTSTSTTRFPPPPERRGPAGFRPETRAPWGPCRPPGRGLCSVFSKKTSQRLTGYRHRPCGWP